MQLPTKPRDKTCGRCTTAALATLPGAFEFEQSGFRWKHKTCSTSAPPVTTELFICNVLARPWLAGSSAQIYRAGVTAGPTLQTRRLKTHAQGEEQSCWSLIPGFKSRLYHLLALRLGRAQPLCTVSSPVPLRHRTAMNRSVPGTGKTQQQCWHRCVTFLILVQKHNYTKHRQPLKGLTANVRNRVKHFLFILLLR